MQTPPPGAPSPAAARRSSLHAVAKNGALGITSTYDAYGNLLADPEAGTSGGIVSYGFDLADRTTSITNAGSVTTLALDALGRVSSRTTGASVDTYSYLGLTDSVVRAANTGGAGATTDSILDPAGDRLGTKTGTTVAWLVPDLHGNVAAGLAPDELTITDALRYDGYGMTVATWPSSGSPASKLWKYQGKLDLSPTTTSLYDFSAREYSPGLGTFTSLDTVTGSAQSPTHLNRFLYAAADPTTLVDPDGHIVSSCNVDECDQARGMGASDAQKASFAAATKRNQAARKASDRKADAYERATRLSRPNAPHAKTATPSEPSGFMRMSNSYLENAHVRENAKENNGLFGALLIGAAIALPLAAMCVALCTAGAATVAAGGGGSATLLTAERVAESPVGDDVVQTTVSEGAPAISEGVQLFRAVEAQEAADIAETGTYRIEGASSYFGKHFYPTIEQAQGLVDRGWAVQVTSTTFPKSVVDSVEPISLASEGPAFFMPRELFPYGPVTTH